MNGVDRLRAGCGRYALHDDRANAGECEQRDILREIVRLRDELDFAVVFITHDLPLLLEISDRIAVMLQGEIVELSTAEQIYADAQHPYTRRLLSSFPSLSGSRGAFIRTGVDEGSPVEQDTRTIVLPDPDDLEDQR